MTKNGVRLVSLPIDELIPEIVAQVLRPRTPFRALVLEAAPGAGKTTRVPAALLDSGQINGQIWVTEPRRLAAKMSAIRVASERGEKLGGRVGYSVRFEERLSADTELVYTTEGWLLRRLAADPELRNVGAIVFDEIHERSESLDLLLALTHRLAERRHASGAPLTLVAMSATLDAAKVAAYWGGAPRLTSHGRSYPIEIEHLSADDRPLAIQVRSGVRRLLEGGLEGDILVFLPGQSEIRQTEEALKALPELEVLPLYGELPLEAQMRAIEPSRDGTRRVILATNIAETSLTIPGVRGVIDSGLGREAQYDPFSLVRRLVTREVSQARLVQRAGRAGRVAPGRVLRLYSAQSASLRPESDVPELLRTSLAETRLFLHDLGVSPSELCWLDSPGAKEWLAGESELAFVGAVDAQGALTRLGKRMARFPLPLRVARMLAEAEDQGIAHAGALAAALLSERDILQPSPRGQPVHTESGPSDLFDRMERIEDIEELGVTESECRRHGLISSQVKNVLAVRDQLLRNMGLPKLNARVVRAELEKCLTSSLLRAFWDRLVERRGQSLVTTEGVSAELDRGSSVHEGQFLLALVWDAPQRAEFPGRPMVGRSLPGRPVVRMAHRVDPNVIFDVLGAEVEAREQYVWNAESLRVDVVSGFYLGVLALEESRGRARPGPAAGQILAKALENKGPKAVDPESRLETLRVRIEVLLQHSASVVPTLEREVLASWVSDPKALFRQALEAAGQEATSLDEVLKLQLDSTLSRALSGPVATALRECCPEEVRLSSGRALRVFYEEGKPPWVASRLQDFFSLKVGPRIMQGRVPLSVHLLAPNHRPVQVTTDLEGFWERHYPSVRRELMRKYPRHLWPEDGRSASPPTPGKIR